jgi:hypothetical protein
MKSLMAMGIIMTFCCALGGCIYISSISVSGVSPVAQTMISSKADAVGILHLTAPPPSDLEDKVVADLKSKGATKNIRVRLEMRDFWVVQLFEVNGQGEK